MSNLTRAGEYCEGPPSFTPEEKQRIRDYQPPGNPYLNTHWMRRRDGQSYGDAAAERKAWCDNWYDDLRRMERMWR